MGLNLDLFMDSKIKKRFTYVQKDDTNGFFFSNNHCIFF